MRMKNLLLITFLFLLSKSNAQPGNYYPEFADHGILITTSAASYEQVLAYPDGKVIALENRVLVFSNTLTIRKSFIEKRKQDGTFDTDFGGDGKIEMPDGVVFGQLALQSDGKIVGVQKNSGKIWRFTTKGEMDDSFDDDGIAQLEVPGVTIFNLVSVTIDSKDRIVVSGDAHVNEIPKLLMARLTASGAMDETFNSTGIRIVQSTSDMHYSGVACKTDSDNKIIVAVKGETVFPASPDFDAFVSRYTEDGHLDVDFATNGSIADAGGDVQVDSKNRIITYKNSDVYRFKSDGSFDKAITEPNGTMIKFIVQTDDRIVFVGFTNTKEIWVSRYLENGSFDPSFGNSGYKLLDLGLTTVSTDIYYCNRILYVAGTLTNEANFGLVLALDASSILLRHNNNVTASTNTGSCYATPDGLDPILVPSNTPEYLIRYKIMRNGQVLEEGNGSVAGKQFQKGVTNVIYSYTDLTEQISSFNVTVEDKQAPIIFCPVGIEINNTPGKCYGTLTLAQLGTPVAQDNCSGAVTTSVTGALSNGEYPIGITTLSWKATDASGNTATCSQTITVTDNEKPTISVTNKNVNTDPGKCYAVFSLSDLGTPVTSDNCTNGLVVTEPILPPDNKFQKGTTQLTWTVTDASGNTATALQTVTVTDNELPTINNLTATPDVLTPPNRKMQDVTIGYTTTDNCGELSTIISNITSSELVDGPGAGNTSPDWEYVDANHVRLRAERIATGSGRTYTITVRCTDVSGNVTARTVNVLVRNSIISPNSGQPFIVNSTVNLKGEFWDKQGNTHTAKWLIDESTTAKASVTEPSGSKNGIVTGSYKFTTPGVYKLQMNVTNQNGVMQYANNNGVHDASVVVYDPNGGYSYGGGWYYSNKGTLVSDPEAKGDVSYGYTVNYYKGAIKPKGETQFRFGDFEFNAVNFDYLVVNGAFASFAGTGKITSVQSGVNFIMSVIDGLLDGSGIDKVRMKIYSKTTGQVYYDNQPGAGDAALPIQAVGTNSSIVISGGNTNVSAANTNQRATMIPLPVETVEELGVVAYPNPSSSSFSVAIRSGNSAIITLQVSDINGRIVETKTVQANSTASFGDHYRPGTYFVRVIQGGQHKELKVIKLSE